ncbi:MAG TPA: hypothetical protein VM925_25555 [Labilithrix sp.]|nr:hypothetical protein [Labilithrix sp.]
MTQGPAVARGSLLAYRVFDVGDTIALDLAEKLAPSAKRLELGGPLIEGIVIAVRPLELVLAECDFVIPGIDRPFHARVSARMFDFGVVSVLYEIPIERGTTFAQLIPVCDALYDSPVLDARGAEHLREIVQQIGSSIEKPLGSQEPEGYTIVFVSELEGNVGVEALSQSETVAKLLLGEQSDKPLSLATRQDVLRNAFSYLAEDLVIIDWNSALVVEPGGSRVVTHVLELATCQLLEFRYYDGLLDRELARVYDYVEKAPRIFRSPFRALTREVLRRFMELTEFTERVDNAIKSVGDVYLARIYVAAITRFRVPEWRESVETKLGLVGRAYELMKGEVEVSRTQLLELTVVILILVEVLAAFQRH